MNEQILQNIKEIVLKHAGNRTGRLDTQIPGFKIIRRISTRQLLAFKSPMIGLVVQGNKSSIICNRQFDYSKNALVINGISTPCTSFLKGVSSSNPFISVCLEIDAEVMSYFLRCNISANGTKDNIDNNTIVIDCSEDIANGFLRLASLLDCSADDVKFLSPLIIQELHYMFLKSDIGFWLKSFFLTENRNYKIQKAVSFIHENYKDSFSIDHLLEISNMSQSNFFKNFKEVTNYTPLQYQKILRLYEAKKMLLQQSNTVSSVAFSIGYTSVSQFIREYKRMFNNTPFSDCRENYTI